MISFVKRNVGFFLLVMAIIVLIGTNIPKESVIESPVIEVVTKQTNNLTTRCDAYIDIKGEVTNPGVYCFSKGDRLFEIIIQAGWFTVYADDLSINLAQEAVDKSVLIVPKKQETLDLATNETSNDEIRYIYVDVKGEVAFPGVYHVKAGVRLYEVIFLAGGFTKDAETSLLNLSSIVTDQMLVNVPKIAAQAPVLKSFYVSVFGEINKPGLYLIKEGTTFAELIILAGGISIYGDISQFLLSGVLQPQQTLTIPKKSVSVIPNTTESQTESSENSHLVNINKATLQTLATLNGIGEILGQRIIDYRAEHGMFQAIEDIMRVTGIKESVYEKIKDKITV